MLGEFLEGLRGPRVESHGAFTVVTPELGLADVPLLMLAAAVEGESRYFRVHGGRNLVLTWEGRPGVSAQAARAVLERERVDACWERESLELPPLFHDLLTPLARRSRHAPLQMIWGERSRPAWPSLAAGPARRSRLTLVDRGLDFEFPGGFAGLEVVARVRPLPGAPWPHRLLWGPALEGELTRIAASLPRP